LAAHAGHPALLVLGLPRGGVPVAAAVAEALGAPLDALVVRKLGVPGHEELALGAVAASGIRVLNERILASFDLSPVDVERVTALELAEAERRELQYRGGRPFPDVRGKTVIVVDDGVATGATLRAAVSVLRRAGAGRIIAAAPVASPESAAQLAQEADAFVCVISPEDFAAVGQWYEDFAPTPDSEVQAFLRASSAQ